MRPEKVKHALPRIRPSLGVVNLRAGVVEEGMVGVIANNLNGKTILLSRLAQSLYFLRSDPTIFVGGNEKRWHLQLFEYLLFRNVSVERRRRGQFGNLAGRPQGKRSAHAKPRDTESVDFVNALGFVDGLVDRLHAILNIKGLH